MYITFWIDLPSLLFLVPGDACFLVFAKPKDPRHALMRFSDLSGIILNDSAHNTFLLIVVLHGALSSFNGALL